LTEFLTHLAREVHVAASTQNQHVKASLTWQERLQEQQHVLRLRTRSEADLGFYIGYTNNLRIRLKVYYEAYIEQADALGRERDLKKRCREKISESSAKALSSEKSNQISLCADS
jgi:hypothetical protein